MFVVLVHARILVAGDVPETPIPPYFEVRREMQLPFAPSVGMTLDFPNIVAYDDRDANDILSFAVTLEQVRWDGNLFTVYGSVGGTDVIGDVGEFEGCDGKELAQQYRDAGWEIRDELGVLRLE